MTNLLVKFGAIFFLSSLINCNDERLAKKYLFRYGYQASFSEKTPIEAKSIRIFQTYAHLPVTGRLNAATIAKMGESRCGMKDPALKVKTSGRARRYVHQGTSWKRLFNKQRKDELRWTLKNTGRTLGYQTVLTVLRQAILYWHRQTNIDFVEVPLAEARRTDFKNIEIIISFVRGWHKDPYAFDGEGGTLAHAFYPHNNEGFSGDVHFDDAEYYTYQSPRGRNLLWVATHELGHSLGLEHSQVREAVMYPWYTKYKPGFKLHSDDIAGIQNLYGSRSKPMPGISPKTTQRPPKLDKGICPKGGRITAIYYNEQYNQKFAFTTDHKIYFLGLKNRIPVLDRYSYYPKKAVPGTIDAVFTTSISKTIKYQAVFTGNVYHIYRGFSRRNGFHSIHNGRGPLKLRFPKRVRKIDATFTWPGNGRTYFFAGTEYWRYDNKNKRFDAKYPKPIKGNWPGLPKQIDSAYSSPDKKTTFFLSGNKYYLFDDRNVRVKATYSMDRFLQCNSAGAITDNLSGGGIGGIGQIGSKPTKTP